MARVELSERIKNAPLILDGAMGTELIGRGITVPGCNDNLNVESPDDVIAVHASYLEAGSDAVITNTFSANSFGLARHNLVDRVSQINLEGTRIARKAAGDDRYVLGDIGPCGDFLEPLGAVKADELKLAFAQQAKALIDGGVDGIIIETMTALDELTVAIEAVRSISDVPVFVSLAFDTAGDDFRTMMGVGPAQAVEQLSKLGITAIGFNCGTLPMAGYVELTKAYAEALAGSDIALIAEPNAGQPELIDGKATYTLSPEDFADAMVKIKAAGAAIIGGCCGTTPGHIRALAEKIKD